jgi:hypothetical protein
MKNKIYSFSGLLASLLFYSAILFLTLNFSEETKKLIIDSTFSITSLNIENFEFQNYLKWFYTIIGSLCLIQSSTLLIKSKKNKTSPTLLIISALLIISCGLITTSQETFKNTFLVLWFGVLRPITILGCLQIAFILFFVKDKELFKKSTRFALISVSILTIISGFIQINIYGIIQLKLSIFSWILYFFGFIIISVDQLIEKTLHNTVQN